MSKEKAKICLESALSEFGLYESLGIRDYLKSAYDNMLKALKELEDEDEFVKCDRLPFTEELWLLHQLVYIGLSCTYTGRGYIIEKLKD